MPCEPLSEISDSDSDGFWEDLNLGGLLVNSNKPDEYGNWNFEQPEAIMIKEQCLQA